MSALIEPNPVSNGLVTFFDGQKAVIWLIDECKEKEVNLAYRSSTDFVAGDWITISASGFIRKIKPILKTRVLKDSDNIVQVKTEVVFEDGNLAETIRHGTVAHSKDLGRVAVFIPFSGVPNRAYEIFLERIPFENRSLEKDFNVHWFVPADEMPFRDEHYSGTSNLPQSIAVMGLLTGVVVSISAKYAFIWTPLLGEGFCDDVLQLSIGVWVNFFADSPPRSHRFANNVNIKFKVIAWFPTEKILPSRPSRNSAVLTTRFYIREKPTSINALRAKWIGQIMDKDSVLDAGILSNGVGKTYTVDVKRVKRSSNNPITAWNVLSVMSVTDGVVEDVVVVRLVDESVVDVYVLKAEIVDCSFLCFNTNICDEKPDLGDWYSVKMVLTESGWTAVRAEKTRQRLKTRVMGRLVEVEAVLALTAQKSCGHSVAVSDLIGRVADTNNELMSISSSFYKICKAWCVTNQKKYANEPLWRISKYSSIIEAKCVDGRISFIEEEDTYLGIVVSETSSSVFVWTAKLGEGICRFCHGLQIGDWIRFSVMNQGTPNLKANSINIHFDIKNLEKVECLFPARRHQNTVVVTVKVFIPYNYVGNEPPEVQYFGMVMDKEHIFSHNLDALRGNTLEMDLRRVKKSYEEQITAWSITYIKIISKDDLAGGLTSQFHQSSVGDQRSRHQSHSNAQFRLVDANGCEANFSKTGSDITHGMSESTDDKSDTGTESSFGYEESISMPSKFDEMKEDDPFQQIAPLVCSMKTLFKSPEVRAAIKENCEAEYHLLCDFYGYKP